MTFKQNTSSNGILRRYHPGPWVSSWPAVPRRLSTILPAAGAEDWRGGVTDHGVDITVPFSRGRRIQIPSVMLSGAAYKAGEVDVSLSRLNPHRAANPDLQGLICQSQGHFIIYSPGGRSCGSGEIKLLS